MTVKKIACCIDFSENANIAFSVALEAAEKFHCELHILHVLPHPLNPLIADFDIIPGSEHMIQNPDELQKSLMGRMEEKLEQEFGNKLDKIESTKMVILSGHVSTEIINYLEEEDIDLVVVGSFGYSGMGLVLFGSVAKRVSHKAHCSVVIARDKKK